MFSPDLQQSVPAKPPQPKLPPRTISLESLGRELLEQIQAGHHKKLKLTDEGYKLGFEPEGLPIRGSAHARSVVVNVSYYLLPARDAKSPEGKIKKFLEFRIAKECGQTVEHVDQAPCGTFRPSAWRVFAVQESQSLVWRWSKEVTVDSTRAVNSSDALIAEPINLTYAMSLENKLRELVEQGRKRKEKGTASP